MTKLPLRSLFQIIFNVKNSRKFLFGTILGFSFSMAVILCTIGLMDGFEFTLKRALSHASGDIKFSSINGFFQDDLLLEEELKLQGIKNYSTIIQIESFAMASNLSRGVLLKGISKDSYSKVTKLDFKNLREGVYIGKELARSYDLKTGDSIKIALTTNNRKSQGAPKIVEYPIEGIIEHGVYEKDLRFIYTSKTRLASSLSYKKTVSNIGYIKLDNFKNIEKEVQKLNNSFDGEFEFTPYWREFEVLLDAVKIEKVTISLILQLIVIVAILNVVAFVIFISETKSQDFIMLRSLGLSNYSIQEFWFVFLGLIWFVSCLFSIFLKELFSYLITNLPFLKIPGDIYVLSKLEILLSVEDYSYVFAVSLLWIIFIGFITMRKLKKRSIVSSLRQEFS